MAGSCRDRCETKYPSGFMPLTPEERHVLALEHARWRVTFRKALLRMHLSTAQYTEEWMNEKAAHEQVLKEAEQRVLMLESMEPARYGSLTWVKELA